MSGLEPTGSEQTEFTGELGGSSEGMDVLQDEDYGVAEGVDLLAEAAPKKKHTGILVLIVVVGLAVGSLFSMHTLTKVTASSGRNTEAERTIDSFLDALKKGTAELPRETSEELVRGHKEVVGILEDDYLDHQVMELSRNPFSITGGPVMIDPTTGNPDYAKGQWRAQVEAAAAKLRLKSVIMGSRPLANINGRIVRLGTVIPVEASRSVGTINFRVKSIAANSVTMVAESPELELKVEKVIVLKR